MRIAFKAIENMSAWNKSVTGDSPNEARGEEQQKVATFKGRSTRCSFRRDWTAFSGRKSVSDHGHSPYPERWERVSTTVLGTLTRKL